MLRFMLIFLLLANLLALAAVQGWLGERPARTEPERLARQIQPERIQLRGEAAPGAPVADATDTDSAAADATTTTTTSTDTDLAGAETPLADEADVAPIVADAADATNATEAAAPTTTPAATPALACMAWAALSSTDADELDARLRQAGINGTRSRTQTPSSWWVRIPPQANQAQAELRVRELRTLGVRDSFIVQDAGPSRFAVSLGVFKTEGRARQMLDQLRNQGVRNAGVEARMSTTFRIQAEGVGERLRSIESAQRGLGARRVACTTS